MLSNKSKTFQILKSNYKDNAEQDKSLYNFQKLYKYDRNIKVTMIK